MARIVASRVAFLASASASLRHQAAACFPGSFEAQSSWNFDIFGQRVELG